MSINDAFTPLDEPLELERIARPVAGAPERREVFLAIDGLHCAACSLAIESALAPMTDLIEVNVVARRARLVFRPAQSALSEILRTIARLDYAPRPVPLDALDHVDVTARRAALWRLLAGLLCMMQVMMFAVPRYLAGDAMTPDLRALMIWAELMLTAPVLLFAAGPFFSSAWADVRRRRIGMDTPIAVGIAVTALTSVAAISRGEDVYFDSLTMFVTLLLLARWLESAARERAASGLADSLARLPETAVRLLPGGRTESVTRGRLMPGDHVRVPAGAIIPSDGEVVTGHTDVDEALLTGESRLIERGPGDPVVAGSLNQSQPIEIVVLRRAVDSRLAELQALVERAGASKPTMLRLADRVAGPFLAAVVVLAGLTGIAWLAIDAARAPWIAASVLIVTCPCAIGLAGPSALLSALGALARRGIAIGSSDALETIARADLVCFDKTGTLTTAVPRVQVLATHGISPRRALMVAAAVERSILHPVAEAFMRAADDTAELPGDRDADAPIVVGPVNVRAGEGVDASFLDEGRAGRVRVGPFGDLIRLEIIDDGAPRHEVQRWATFELLETLRSDAQQVVDALRQDGAACRITSGDHQSRVDRVARILGFSPDTVDAAQTPEGKLQRLRSAQDDGRVVMMIGDGVNDAPVLRQADVSVSFAAAAPLARHHADVLLLGERLDAILVTRRAARKALRIVNQNLSFAIAYNVIAIPLAVAGLLPPWLAGVGMAASSLVVVANALRAGRIDDCR